MTEKRFNFNLILGEDEHKGLIFDNEQVMKTTDVAYLLNELLEENKELKKQVEDLYESDKSLRKFVSNTTLNYNNICIPRRLFDEVLNILKVNKHNDLVEDLNKESINTSTNGC